MRSVKQGRYTLELKQEAVRFVESGQSTAEAARNLGLGYHLKSGHTLSVQNRPTGLAEDVIVLPCRSVCMQGVD